MCSVAVESELAVARKEIEYLKSESEEALEKKEKQVCVCGVKEYTL